MLRVSHPALRMRALPLRARSKHSLHPRIDISDEVSAALAEGRPVVALESTIITHGMPHPTNLATAQSVERILRAQGCVPATIGILGGRVRVGLTDAELAHLADPASSTLPVKVSRRDLAGAIAGKRDGGTTVAGTMVLARAAGIDAFVTGGIGGVHRGGENSMDVSADLIELGRTPMMVVCAGAKSILDIPRTLEVLETEGVCVASYGQKEFPAFYSPSSGCAAPWPVNGVAEAAELVYTGLSLPDPLGTLLGVPIPAEYGPQGAEVQAAVEQAVRESVEQGIDKRGKEVTPWLLKRVGELTQGKALHLNIKLIENNALIGGQVAAEVARLRTGNRLRAAGASAMPATPAYAPASAARASAHLTPADLSTTSPLPAPKVLVFGAAAVDITAATPKLTPHTTSQGSVRVSPGGVARNIAEAAQALLPAQAVQLVSAIGTEDETSPDGLGRLLTSEMSAAGMRTDGLVLRRGATAACTLVLGGGELAAGVAAMDIVETLDAEAITSAIDTHSPSAVAFDCNLTPGAITALVAAASSRGIPAFADPTSFAKAPRLIPALQTYPRSVHVAPNTFELDALYDRLVNDGGDAGWEFVNSLNLDGGWRAAVEALARRNGAWITDEGTATKMVTLLPFASSVWVTAGPRGVLHLRIEKAVPKGEDCVSHKLRDGFLVLTHHPAPAAQGEVVSTTGAGDTLTGGLVACLVSGDGVAKAFEGVRRTLASVRAVGR